MRIGADIAAETRQDRRNGAVRGEYVLWFRKGGLDRDLFTCVYFTPIADWDSLNVSLFTSLLLFFCHDSDTRRIEIVLMFL